MKLSEQGFEMEEIQKIKELCSLFQAQKVTVSNIITKEEKIEKNNI